MITYFFTLLHFVFKHGIEYWWPRCQRKHESSVSSESSVCKELPNSSYASLSFRWTFSIVCAACLFSKANQGLPQTSVNGMLGWLSSPASMDLCALNSCPPTNKLQSVNLEPSHRLPRSSESWHSGTFSMFVFDWPEMFTESWTTLT